MALTKNQVSEIRLRLANGEKGCDLANEFGVSDAYISQIKSHKRGMKQVWLTVEEAKRVELFLDNVVELYNQEHIKIFSNGFETIYMFKDKVRQADKGYEAE